MPVPKRGPVARGAPRETLEVGLVVPLQGPAGIFGPSCEASAQLAVEEINAGAGVLGREIRLVTVDGGQEPHLVAEEVDRLVSSGKVDAVTGWHISAVRQAVAPRTTGRVPYVYTPLYEGGERTPGVFLAGETPRRQLLPSMYWVAQELGVRRWCVVGDDYVWPRASAAAAHQYVLLCGGEICAEVYVRLGAETFEKALATVERSGADAVLMLLVGEDAVRFNREFAARGLDSSMVRLSPLMEENMLLATGAEATRGLYAASAFFESLPSQGGLDFTGRYHARFGPEAPTVNALGESCYEGIVLLSQLLTRAGGLDLPGVCGVAEGLGYDGPRGSVHLRDNHLEQAVYLARADGLEFDVLDQIV